MARVIDGQYRLDKKIGEGGIGEVYRATDLTTGQQVAVKIMTPKAIKEDFDGLMRKLFIREPVLADRVGPGAVRPIEQGEDDDGTLYVVMELLQGQDLHSKAEKSGGKLPVKTVVPAIESALDTLSEAHRRGVVHRDIKPENLFSTSDGKIKIIDFGMADTTRGAAIPAGEILGTEGYMPPEQQEGRKATAKSDVYSVGATAYELLSGEAPEPFCPLPSLREVAPNVPEYVANAVDHALACNPRARPTTDQFKWELEGGLDHAGHVSNAMAMNAMHGDDKMSTGAKLAVGVAVAGVLFGVYKLVTGVGDMITMFSETVTGQWIIALPPGAWEEEDRLAQHDMAALPAGIHQNGVGVLQIDVSQTGTSFPWPAGTTFWKYPHGKLSMEWPGEPISYEDATRPVKTASGPGTVIASVFAALLVAGGVVAWKANQLVDALTKHGLEIVPPGKPMTKRVAVLTDVQKVFMDVLGGSVGASMLNYAMSNGWQYQEIVEAQGTAGSIAAGTAGVGRPGAGVRS